MKDVWYFINKIIVCINKYDINIIYHFYLKGLPSILPKFILGLIPIEINYWNNNLQAYGILTWYTALPLQLLQILLYLKNPQPSHISTVV